MALSTPTLNFVKSKLSSNQKRLIYDAINFKFVLPTLSKKLVLILGCQRSGTTLTFLMLNSHPKLTILDETESQFDYLPLNSMFQNWIEGNFFGCKLPAKVGNIEYINRYFPHVKIVWPIRNPYSVISSMKSLDMGKDSWINLYGKLEIKSLTSLFPEINDLNIDLLDEASMGAYIWKYKNLAIKKYQERKLNIFPFKYEDLLENPQKIASNLLDFIGLEWNESILEYNRKYKQGKQYAGKTRGDKPLNLDRKKPKLNLSDTEIETIASICNYPMKIYGY